MIIEKVDLNKFKEIFNELLEKGFECLQTNNFKEAYEYLIEKTSIRFTYKDQMLPEMEIKFVKDIVDEYQIKTKTKLKLTGLDIWFSNINVNIAFKEGYLKSNKDIEDAKHLRIVYSEKVDEEEINKVIEMIKRCRL